MALLADSSYRDALSLLEKVLSVTDEGEITRENIEQITGAPRHVLIRDLSQALSERNTEKALLAVRTAESKDVDFGVYMSLLLEQLRAILLLRFAPEMRAHLQKEIDADVFTEIDEIASDSTSQITEKTLLAFLDASARMRYSSVKSLPIELAILSLR